MYIRTKDGIYKVESETCHKQGYYIDRYEEDVILKKQVIKRSENLEELCDRFVVIDKETKEVVNIVSFLAYAKLWSSCKYNIYGSIWTDKGLIYVARMNDKGELELIWAIFGLDG